MTDFYAQIPAQVDFPSPGMMGKTVQQDFHRERFDRENRLLRLCGIVPDAVFIGDSITQDWSVDKVLTEFFPLALNRGVGGDCAAHLGGRLEADVLALRPKNVHLMMGQNDVSYRFGYDTDDTIVQDFADNMTPILHRLHESGARCFLGACHPPLHTQIHDRNSDRKMTCLPRMNAFLRDIAPSLGMIFVDYWPHFLDAEGAVREDLYTDGIHLNARGQYLMTLVLKQALTDHE